MTMQRLDELENQSIYIIREAWFHFNKPALLWSIGKDSTTLLWLCRKAFLGKIPFPVLHIDTGYKFDKMYAFRDTYAKQWDLDLIVARNESAMAAGMAPTQKLQCCSALKTEGLKQAVREQNFEALLLGIRRDEHGVRAKERYFSPRNDNFEWNYMDQPPELWDQYRQSLGSEDHIRVHPLLHWRELDIWRYIKREQIPITDLYFSHQGQRYRSIGCVPVANRSPSQARTVDEIIAELEQTRVAERSGRAQDKENAYTMQKLRALGYM